MVNSLINSRGYDLLSVRFGAESPHLVATVALEALSDEQAAAGFLGVEARHPPEAAHQAGLVVHHHHAAAARHRLLGLQRLELQGHVQLRITRLAGTNAVLSGLFFDPTA